MATFDERLELALGQTHPTGNYGSHPIADSNIRPNKLKPLTGFLFKFIDNIAGP